MNILMKYSDLDGKKLKWPRYTNPVHPVNLTNHVQTMESVHKAQENNKVLNHDSKGLRDGHDFKTSKKSSNHENPKNQGSDK